MTAPTAAAHAQDDHQGPPRGACGSSTEHCSPGQTRCGAAPCEESDSVLTPAVQRVIEWHRQRMETH